MDILRTFVINLSVTIIFFTAIKLILPENSMKKYVKFVMGIILIAVMIQPILTIFNSSEKISAKIEKNIKINNINSQESNNNINEGKKQAFLENLEKSCEALLKNENEGLQFKVKVNGDIDLEKVTVNIKEVKVWVDDSKTIKKIQKIKIGSNEKEEPIKDSLGQSIKSKLSKELGISKDKIIIYKS